MIRVLLSLGNEMSANPWGWGGMVRNFHPPFPVFQASTIYKFVPLHLAYNHPPPGILLYFQTGRQSNIYSLGPQLQILPSTIIPDQIRGSNFHRIYIIRYTNICHLNSLNLGSFTD